MRLPRICPDCKALNFVDMDVLQKAPIDKIRSEAGYTCENCGAFQRLYVTTNSLEESMKKLNKINISRREFYWHFGKTLKKAIGLQKDR